MHEAEELTSSRRVFFFSESQVECDPARKDLLGGKGASLAAMCRAGLPVPPGFTISIACCRYYHEHGKRWPAGLEDEVRSHLTRLEQATGKRFATGENPLLVSVRSGAAVSMPGMMDTILNCGLHSGLAEEVAHCAHFWTVYAQFCRQFGATVANIKTETFEAAALAANEAPLPPKALAEAHMALYETASGKSFPTDPWQALKECIIAVFDSWNNDRAIVYRKAHGLESLEGTAVTVQAMFNSWMSGIAFTANPSNPSADEIIIESSYGLGESVVSGDVTPDRFVLDAKSFAIRQRAIGHKTHVIRGLGCVGQAADPDVPSLNDHQLGELASMAVSVENYFGHPVDLEWGLENGRLALLQSRPIRGLDVARDVELGRREEIERLKRASQNGKVWVVHNLAETLPSPTPLTWDIIRGFMSGDGGYGQMYVDFGFRPSKRFRQEGFLDLICGRIYADPDRAAEQFWGSMPFGYDHAELLKDPHLLEAAPTKFDAQRADEKFLLRLPSTFWAMFRSSRLLKKARREAIPAFQQKVPTYLAYLAEKRSQDLLGLTTAQLVEELNYRIRMILTDFGKESLKPGFFGGCARAELERLLVQLMGPREGMRVCQVLTSGLDGDSTLEQDEMLFRVAVNVRQGAATEGATLADFLDRYGHRAVAEMELAKRRWREDPSYLEQIIGQQDLCDEHSPAHLHKLNKQKRLEAVENLPELLKIWGGSSLREEIEALATEAQSLLPYREIGKHYLTMGYAEIRRVLLEFGRRFALGDDVFFLKLAEISEFEKDPAKYSELAEKRKVRWKSAQKLDLPEVIDSADLDQLGLPRKLQAQAEMPAVALSGGVALGTAKVVFHPADARNLGSDAILVCPSTDPSWTALFTAIKGLVVERGGVLSHGAITARDFGIPAVACPDATQIIKSGAKVRVDGDRGHITIVEA